MSSCFHCSVYGGDITGTSGQIASPLYPNQYPHNTDYTWTITVAVGARIRITFVALDMEGSTNCVYDYVRVRTLIVCTIISSTCTLIVCKITSGFAH